jgi:serine O-acetyltransferase
MSNPLRSMLQPGKRAVAIFRWSHWAAQHRLSVLGLLLQNVNLALHCCDISYKSTIGEGFLIYHPTGIVAAEFVAGKNLILGQNSTVGGRDGREQNGRTTPRIGDRVTINAGAAVVGPITLGDDVVVGINSVVLKDVSSGMTVVGIPAREISRKPIAN